MTSQTNRLLLLGKITIKINSHMHGAPLIILDFETNSANIHDVIEVAVFRIKREEGMYVIADTFHRYCFSEYEVNPDALAVHKLSPQRIQRLRANVDYVDYFEKDEEFVNFCKGSKTLWPIM